MAKNSAGRGFRFGCFVKHDVAIPDPCPTLSDSTSLRLVVDILSDETVASHGAFCRRVYERFECSDVCGRLQFAAGLYALNVVFRQLEDNVFQLPKEPPIPFNALL